MEVIYSYGVSDLGIAGHKMCAVYEKDKIFSRQNNKMEKIID